VTDQINELFARALGITEPWFVKEVDFDGERHEMTIHADARKVVHVSKGASVANVAALCPAFA
jgi:hypothetical protein